MVYNEVFDEFGLIVHDGGQSYVLIQHCPWCATRLPESQRDRWFDEENPPLAYTTREWRLNELKT